MRLAEVCETQPPMFCCRYTGFLDQADALVPTLETNAQAFSKALQNTRCIVSGSGLHISTFRICLGPPERFCQSRATYAHMFYSVHGGAISHFFVPCLNLLGSGLVLNVWQNIADLVPDLPVDNGFIPSIVRLLARPMQNLLT